MCVTLTPPADPAASDSDNQLMAAVLNTNVLGLAAATREAINSMKKHGVSDGHVVNIGRCGRRVRITWDGMGATIHSIAESAHWGGSVVTLFCITRPQHGWPRRVGDPLPPGDVPHADVRVLEACRHRLQPGATRSAPGPRRQRASDGMLSACPGACRGWLSLAPALPRAPAPAEARVGQGRLG